MTGRAVRLAWPGRLRLSRPLAEGLLVLLDSLVVISAYVAALDLRFDASVPELYAARFRAVAVPLATVYVLINVAFGMYRRSWRYASLRDALALVRAVAVSTGLVLVADAALTPLNHPLPLSVIPVGGLLALLGMGLIRFRHRLYEEAVVAFTRSPRSPLLIIGAGQAGQWLARELLASPALGYRPVCFVDDDPEKQGQRIHGLPVAGTRHDIGRLVQEHGVEVIALAIPTLSEEERRAILAFCEATPARVKILPGLPDLLTAYHDGPIFRDVRLEDLLGRPPVMFTVPDGVLAHWECVLVTGAAGSIGSELARQLAASGIQRLVLVDIDETGLFDLAGELASLQRAGRPAIETVIADITRLPRLRRVFARARPSVVFHAAAYKHVPLMETHPEEAVLTNVLGTYHVCLAAEECGSRQVVFISTDKAVAPASVMGATKRVGERIVESFARESQTIFCAVRFGNVLGSRGSVVPTFTRQIRQGGPLTVTHPAMTRYFMTIPEAVNLIIEASAQAEGGEVFVLDMGQPVSILDLARKMIRLHGLRPGEDIEIREIGIRPGEKLHESLTDEGESLVPTRHARVSKVLADAPVPLGRDELASAIQHLTELVESESQSREVLVAALYHLAGARPPGQDEPLASSAPGAAARARRA